MEKMTTSQLARESNVNLETIRYYERRGLIPKPPRNASGYRQYSQEDIARTKFIKRAQALGFSLREILEIFSLRIDGKLADCCAGRGPDAATLKAAGIGQPLR